MKSKKFKVGMRVKVKNSFNENERLINHIGTVTCNECLSFVGVSFNGYKGHDNCGTCKKCNGICLHINDLDHSNLSTTEVKYPKKPKISPYKYSSDYKGVIYAHDRGHGFIIPPRIRGMRQMSIIEEYISDFSLEGIFNEQEDIPVE